jgi:hypothetical protein
MLAVIFKTCDGLEYTLVTVWMKLMNVKFPVWIIYKQRFLFSFQTLHEFWLLLLPLFEVYFTKCLKMMH